MLNKIRIVVAPVTGEFHEQIITKDLRGLQAVVGGLIEVVQLPHGTLVCNEEGKILGLPRNQSLCCTPHIEGQAFFTKTEGEDFVSLSDADIAIIRRNYERIQESVQS